MTPQFCLAALLLSLPLANCFGAPSDTTPRTVDCTGVEAPSCDLVLNLGFECSDGYAELCPGVEQPSSIPPGWTVGSSCPANCGGWTICADNTKLIPIAIPGVRHCQGDEQLDQSTCTAAACGFCYPHCPVEGETCSCDQEQSCTSAGGSWLTPNCDTISTWGPFLQDWCQTDTTAAAMLSACCTDGITNCRYNSTSGSLGCTGDQICPGSSYTGASPVVSTCYTSTGECVYNPIDSTCAGDGTMNTEELCRGAGNFWVPMSCDDIAQSMPSERCSMLDAYLQTIGISCCSART
jgi:hypothetical protein